MLHLERRLTGETDVGFRLVLRIGEPRNFLGSVENSHYDHSRVQGTVVQKTGGSSQQLEQSVGVAVHPGEQVAHPAAV